MIKALRWTLLYALLLFFAFVSVGPFLWLVSTSLKSGNVFAYPPELLPEEPTLEAYITVWNAQNMPRFSCGTRCSSPFGVCSRTWRSRRRRATRLARVRFPGRNIIFGLILSTLVLPDTVGIIVNFITLARLGLVNTIVGVVLPYAVVAVNVFIMRQAFIGIPSELEDAARIDGASAFGIWWRIMLPLVRPALMTVVIFQFVNMWNLYIWPLIVLQDPDKYPLSVAIASLTQGELSLNFSNIAAATVISIIPVILLFLALQRYFIEGLAGSVKG